MGTYKIEEKNYKKVPCGYSDFFCINVFHKKNINKVVIAMKSNNLLKN